MTNSKKEIIYEHNEKCVNCDKSIYYYSLSPNEKYLYYLEIDKSEALKFIIIDLVSKKPIDTINNATNLQWNRNSDGFYYISSDSTHTFPNVLFYHTLGSKFHDRLIYKSLDKTQRLMMNTSKSKDILFVYSGSVMHNKLMCTALRINDLKLKEIKVDNKTQIFEMEHYKEMYYAFCNFNAKNNCVLTTDNIKLPLREWKVLIPESSEYLNRFQQTDDYYILSYKDGLSKNIKLVDRKTLKQKEITPNEKPSVIDGYSVDNKHLKLNYESYFAQNQKNVNIDSLYMGKYDGEFKLPDSTYSVDVYYYDAKNNVKVPIVVLRNKRTKLKKSNPVIAEVYGAGGTETFLPSYSKGSYSLIDKGYTLALVLVSGGGELGYEWMMAGNGAKKIEGINDYLGACEYLKKELNTNHLFASGTSAGGEIVAYAANNTSGLFDGFILNRPLTNLIAYNTDSLQEGAVAQRDMDGDPYNKADYLAMKAIDPYLNMKNTNANILIIGGLYDDRVFNFYNAKYTAKQRYLGNPNIYFRTFMNAGHSSLGEGLIYEKMLIYNFMQKCMEKRK